MQECDHGIYATGMIYDNTFLIIHPYIHNNSRAHSYLWTSVSIRTSRRLVCLNMCVYKIHRLVYIDLKTLPSSTKFTTKKKKGFNTGGSVFLPIPTDNKTKYQVVWLNPVYSTYIKSLPPPPSSGSPYNFLLHSYLSGFTTTCPIHSTNSKWLIMKYFN